MPRRDSRREELAQVRRERQEAARARREALRRGERPDREELRAALVARRAERRQERRLRRQERRPALASTPRPDREEIRAQRATAHQARAAARKHRREFRRAKRRLSRRASLAQSRVPRYAAIGFVGIAAVAGVLAGRSTEDGEGRAPAPAEPAQVQAERAEARYERGLENALAGLGERREGPLERLRRAKAPAEQAAALEALARQHRRAARDLRALRAPAGSGGAPAALLAALNAAGDGYERMAQAASQSRSSAYEAASADVRASESRLQRAVRRMGSRS